MAKTPARGLRCAACTHLIGRTTKWAALAMRKETMLLCAECADDLLAMVRRLQAERARPRRPAPARNGRYLAVSAETIR